MKKSIVFLAGLFSGIILFALVLSVVASKTMFSVNESKYDFAKTTEIITESVKTNNWSMPHQYNLQKTMENHGFAVRPVVVFSICKPDIAVRILDNDNERHVSAMMPCRIAVYEKADGKTYVSRMNAGLFSKLLGGNATAIMGEAGNGSEDILKSVIK
ncbi:MAG: DUF302 domain-containing protein [Prolixibacteraceae bacterium]